MKKLDEYLKLEKEIHEYFGYQEDWRAIPIDDRRENPWFLRQDEPFEAEHPESFGGEVIFFDDDSDVEDDLAVGNYYSNDIYTQRFLPKWVYRGEEYTMVCVDTNTDGNKFLQIFDNSKEIKKHE